MKLVIIIFLKYKSLDTWDHELSFEKAKTMYIVL